MIEEEKERMQDYMKTLLKALYNLSYANALTVIMKQLKGRNILQAEEAYPEIFDNPTVRPYFHLFLSINSFGKMSTSSFGEAFEKFIEYVNTIFDDEELTEEEKKTMDEIWKFTKGKEYAEGLGKIYV